MSLPSTLANNCRWGLTPDPSLLSCRQVTKALLIPAGYMAKRVAARPDWLSADRVKDIYSVSGCISEDFADDISFWQHNGYWFFDSPQAIQRLAQEASIDLAGTTLFYYEAHDRQFDDERDEWTTFEPDGSVRTSVQALAQKVLQGIDVVSVSMGAAPECSPLSCNSLASEVETNEHCLLPALDSAKLLLERGAFRNCEPGPYRIFAVHTPPWPVNP
jgi:hypothetical protein